MQLKKLFVAGCAALALCMAWADVKYVAPLASGDGSSWESPGDVRAVLAAAGANDEIRLAVGEYDLSSYDASDAAIVAEVPVSVVGGYSVSTGERIAGGRSVLSGSAGIGLKLSAAAAKSFFLDAVTVTNCQQQGVVLSGGANLSAIDCTFVRCGSKNAHITGRGVMCSGSTSMTTVTFTNCVFAFNKIHGSVANCTGSNVDYGQGVYLSSLKRATFGGCRFLRNGQPDEKYSDGPARDGCAGAAIYASSAPLTVSDCAFLGNKALAHNTSDGGIVYLATGCGGTTFDHCRFVGNSHCYWNTSFKGNSACGTVTILSSGAIGFNHCTFGFNIANQGMSGGLLVKGGTVTVSNCVFGGNIADTRASSAGDIYQSAGIVAIDHSVFASKDAAYIASAGGTLTYGEGVQFADPLFASTVADMSAAMNVAAVVPRQGGNFYYTNLDAAMALDVHLKSRAGRWLNGEYVQADDCYSPALDAGDPAAPYVLEPDFNGNCANAGCYGNTTEASKSSKATPEFALASAEMIVGDYTRPKFSCALREDDDMYTATLYLCYGTTRPETPDAEGWQHVRTLASAVHPGDVFEEPAICYFKSGAKLYWRFYAVMGSGVSTMAEGELTVSGTEPPQWERGGGEGVIHVWAGGQGTAGGTSWLDAVPTLNEAANLVDATHTNIWIAGTVSGHGDAAIIRDIGLAVSVRGGFTGMENAIEDRPVGLRATIDNATRSRSPSFTASAGATLFERINFVNSVSHGLDKSGAASLELRDCDFVNCTGAVKTKGIGLSASGGGGARLSLSNCTFRGCCITSGDWGDTSGVGAWISTFAQASLTDCHFVTNGLAPKLNFGIARDGTVGWALCLDSAPATVERCSFVGTRVTAHNAKDTDGSVVWANRACTFRNCFWTGTRGGPNGTGSNGTGAGNLTVSLGSTVTCLVENCTFAYNSINGGVCAGVNVLGGNLTVRNMIFHGNVGDNRIMAADVWLKSSSARAAASYAIFDATNSAHVGGVSGSAVTFGDGILTGDPLFWTPTESAMDVERGTLKSDFSGVTANLHLIGRGGYVDEVTGELVRGPKNVRSPAIDAGDPASPYGNEPKPNGRRVNLGGWGNTPYATRLSAGGMMLMVF